MIIDWTPIDELDIPRVHANILREPLMKLGMKALVVYAGQNVYAPHEVFLLQYLGGEPESRQALLIANDISGGAENPINLEITIDHVADAAGFLGFRWFNWLPDTRSRVLIMEEPPPEGDIEVFRTT